ncbi:FAD-binding oxidoreductase [Fulvivirga sp. RKSG066]|uniref:NAD(P)/FAD-dependent oxidoreductase n=1 Tax=Fulvivirga aurantia TaxID=2529383 RepID=UPI0012BC2FBD|nr:FAD-dependent oxidoreductase [Fulvivirga aurantia]MTI22270.1 FAD-binding oxidoreductase [Fulvivirga aurantia]
MISFWEQQSFTSYSYAVVGSGIVGLSTALALKEKEPQARVVVLERGLLPTGASTKNAGFACFGSLTELLDDLKVMSEEECLALVTERVKGLEKLRARLGDEKLDYLNYGGYELIDQEDLESLDHIDRINTMLSPLFEKPVFTTCNGEIDKFGFNKDLVPAMTFNQYEGQINTGEMMKNLLDLAREKGIEVITGAEVTSLEEKENHVEVHVAPKVTDGFMIKAKKVACCTNAFTGKLLSDLDLSPGRGIVLVTKPIDNLKFKGVFHSDKGYYYFRNFENRVIFGGGRNMDFEAEETTEFKINEVILNNLEEQLKTKILPDTPFEVDHTWAGIMAFGNTKQPILKQYSKNISLGVRLGGMGVAIGSRMGEQLAEMMV